MMSYNKLKRSQVIGVSVKEWMMRMVGGVNIEMLRDRIRGQMSVKEIEIIYKQYKNIIYSNEK